MMGIKECALEVLNLEISFMGFLDVSLRANGYEGKDMGELNKGATIGPRVAKVPKNDNRERMVCPECGYILYDNPKIVAGAVVVWQEQYLLCRRAISPRKGYWTIPAGYLELNETVVDGARREVMEEACADIIIHGLLAVYNIPRISQVQMIYSAELSNRVFAPGIESLEVDLFAWEHIPWEDLAFPSVSWALNHHHASEGKSRGQPFSNPDNEWGR